MNSKRKTRVSEKGIPMRVSADFSAEALQARTEWHDTVKALEGKTCKEVYSTQPNYHLDY